MKILKENEEGFGIIIDQDGNITKELNENFLNEGVLSGSIDLTKPIYYYATLQKYGVENRNGRIYPEDILKREVERYREVISRNASFHELDHPQECCDIDTEILTKNGWEYLKDISPNDDVYTLNQVTNNIELKTISNKVDQPYNGKMIQLLGRNFDMLVTPNHKFWVVNKRTMVGKFISAQEIHNKELKSSGDYFIPKTGNWVGENFKTITIPGVPKEKLGKRCSKDLIEKYSHDLVIDADIFFRFMGIWLSEGSVQGSNGDTSYGYKVSIAQRKKENIELIRNLLTKMPLHWGESGIKTVDFVCSDARLHAYLKPLGNSFNKYIPYDIKQGSSFLLNELFEWFLIGDGRIRGNKKDVFSTSKTLINDLHEILIKCGGSGNVHEEDRKFDRYIGDRLIKGCNSKNMFFLNISSTNGIWLDYRNLKTEEIEYNKNIYCVEVPNNIFYARRNGKAAWTGNSVISLKGGSPHRIVDMFWEGNALIGKLEILVSEGYRKNGVISCNGDLTAMYLSYGMTLGISSRGIGSLKKANGKNVVQDDFELICWDIVSSPSTPGSYLYKNHEDFSKYDEKLTNTPEMNTGSRDKQDEFLSKLTSFLSK